MKIEATHLGRLVPYPKSYDSKVLVAVPRKLNREQYGIQNNNLPFDGVDVWHAYEFGFMTEKGLPVVGLLKIVYPANSEFLVESKSLKLYLNSFNMEGIGDNVEDGVNKVISTIQNDLQKLLECKVDVTYFDHKKNVASYDFEKYEILENSVCDIDVSDFNESPDLLDDTIGKGMVKWGTHLLRSNCKITNQPDWGSLFVIMDSERQPSKQSFLKYVISLRNENHFHEEICEMVYQRLYDKYKPQNLMVCCLYTRRGGIDINPVRASDSSLLPKHLVNPVLLSQQSFRQ